MPSPNRIEFMKTKRISSWLARVTLAVVIVAAAFSLTSCKDKTDSGTPSAAPRLIVGWQTAWATCGQIIETLVHTDICKLYGSSATFRNFLFGPDMNEAALSGSIDATTTGTVPTINLLAASDDWVVVCRLIDFNVSMVARTGTGITNIAGLRGHKVGVPFGGGSHPYVVQRLKENNLPIGTGPDAVELINVTPAEAATVMQQGSVDAVATWEPQTTIIESKGFGKAIEDTTLNGFLTVRKSLAEKYPEQVVALIKALIEANFYVAQHREQTDAWFAKRSNFDRELLKKIRVVELNVKAQKPSDISVDIAPAQLKTTQEVADQMLDLKLIKRPVSLKQRMNLAYLERAISQLRNEGYRTSQIKQLSD